MRRGTQPQDSFDLFLDTICNTFGGIIFLAILVAILIQNRSMQTLANNPPLPQGSPEEVRSLIRQISLLEVETSNLEINLQSLPAPQNSNQVDSYIQQKATLATLEGKLRTALKTQTGNMEQLKALLQNNKTLSAEILAVPRQLAELATKIDTERSKVEILKGKHQTTLRLPKESKTMADSTLALIKTGKVFVAGDFNKTKRSFEGDGVATKVIPNGYRIIPIAGRGQATTAESLAPFIESMRQKRQIITVAVWPDSFADFPALKSRLVTAGVRYQIWLQSPDDELLITIGSDTSNRVQ